ncbi:hypothetical protein D3C78_924070 [compost metagenome]
MERNLMPSGCFLQACREAFVKCMNCLPCLIAAVAAASESAVVRQLSLVVVALQIHRPVTLRLGMVLILQPCDVAAVTRPLCSGTGWQTPMQRLLKVPGKYILDDERQAPAVHHDMMEAPQHLVFVIFGPYDRHPHERIALQIEAAFPVELRQRLKPQPAFFSSHR